MSIVKTATHILFIYVTEAYTAKTFWIVVAVLGLLILLLIGIVVAMRSKIHELKKRQYTSSSGITSPNYGKDNPALTVT